MGVHANSLADSLSGADLVFIYRPDGVDDSFEASLASLGDCHQVYGDYDELVAAMSRDVEAGDQVVFMSNGGFGSSRQTLTAVLQRTRSS